MLWAVLVGGTPYNSPTVDGVIEISAADWDSDELVGDDPADDSHWLGNDIDNIYLTWDANYLYIGVEYEISDNAMIIYFEDGTPGGVTDFNSERGYSGAFPRNITFPDSVGIDFIVASWNGDGPYVYLTAEGTSTDLTGECLAATGDSYSQEVAIPWSVIYPDAEGTVIPGAQLRIVGVIAGGDNWGAADAVPDNPSVDGGEGPHLLTEFITVPLDTDGDGIPDFSGGALYGTVHFDDPQFASPPYPAAQISVYPAGGNLAVASAVSSPEDGSFILAGLDTGTYDICAFANGFVPETLQNFAFDGNDTVEITLEPYTGTIFGAISPDSITVWVFALADGDTIGFGDTAAGEYEITHLPEGVYSVVAVPLVPEYSVWETSGVALAGGESLRVDIRLEMAGVVREVEDAVGDDYGPGWYLYPTDRVFVSGAFDITYVKIRDLEDKYQFEIGVREIPDSSVVWWSPYYPPLNLQKIDIYIDCHSGGARVALPNRNAGFVATDAWDFAISADGWWKGLLASNGQDIFSNFTQDVEAVEVSADTVNNRIYISVDKSALVDNLGMADTANFDQWDFLVVMMGHDGDGVEGVRWVNSGTGNQWQFNGGADGDIDPNIIDLVAMPGVDQFGNPKEPGRSQEEMLDYTVQTPVQLETHRSYDISPPVIEYQIPSQIVHLAGRRGVYFEVKIDDDVAVERAFLFWRNIGGEWQTPVPLGFRERVGAFVGDIPAEEVNPDSFEFYFYAEDPSDNATYLPQDYPDTAEPEPPTYPFSTVSPVPTRVVPHITEVDTVDISLAVNTFTDSVAEKFPDGTIFVVRREDIGSWVDTVHIRYFACVPGGKTSDDLASIGQFAALSVWAQDSSAPFVNPQELSFHYYEPPDSPFADEENFVLGVLNPYGVWVGVGGRNLPDANCVDAAVNPDAGTYVGVFAGKVVRTDEPIAAVVVSPNPFSPNGDGVCDATNITIDALYPGNVDMDIFNTAGEHIITLAQNLQINSGRNENIVWDGRDEDGSPCPMGIYILAVRFKYVFEGNERWFRKNVGIAIVR